MTRDYPGAPAPRRADQGEPDPAAGPAGPAPGPAGNRADEPAHGAGPGPDPGTGAASDPAGAGGGRAGTDGGAGTGAATAGTGGREAGTGAGAGGDADRPGAAGSAGDPAGPAAASAMPGTGHSETTAADPSVSGDGPAAPDGTGSEPDTTPIPVVAGARRAGSAGGPGGSRPGLGPSAAAALVLAAALLAGAVGGVVGVRLAAPAPSPGVLGAPVPGIEEASAPVGPVEAVAARVLPSVVQLRVEAGPASGGGSGMVLSADGLLLTNNHVVAPAVDGGTVTAVFNDGSTAPTRIIGRDPGSDLAVLRAEGVSGLVPVELGNSDAVRVGQPVVAFGSPLGLGGTVTAGIVSAKDRAVSVDRDSGASEATVLNALQTDAAINPGNSGGPLTDMQGRVIGINSAIATTGERGGSIGVGFSIPVNQARRIADELERTGTATRPILGVNLAVGGSERTGARIEAVVPGGPADQAGLRQGETVTRVDDRVITTGDELVAAIRDRAPGDRITLTVDGREVEVTLGSQTG